ncbi:Cellobiose dehydrogenase [Lachnellula suecica]|uniref:Cellobiose dehydrogenase n=1 Tax=Lachnellula suecica TaxID=602035 RepID=A0A8T9C8Z0_9HELO|nr:Cellobiose dehydrogenase [Lachnellula suecica]
MRFLVGSLALLAATVCGQNLVEWTEASSGVQYSIGIPEAAAAPFDVYLSITAPANITYAAIAFGGCMLRSPLLVAWKSNSSIVTSSRWAAAYHPPTIYNGTAVAISKTSSVNSTYWTAELVCSGCSSWLGGSVGAFGNVPLGWALSSSPLANPASSNGSIPYHNVGKDHFEINITNARNTPSQFGALISGAKRPWSPRRPPLALV